MGVVVAMLAILAVLSGSGIGKNMTPNTILPSAFTSVSTEVKPITVQYNGSSVLSVTDKDATIETKFNLTNTNDVTLIIETVTYDVYVNGVIIGHGQYGEKFEDATDSSTYLPLTQHNSEIITTKAQLINDGNNPQVWSALQSGTEKIRISGTVYYSTHSPFAGQTYSNDFDLQ